MYVIIGGDGKEYGPISGADLRRWISEERLNARSLVKAESDAEFRHALDISGICRSFGNCGAGFSTPPPLGSASIGSREKALQRVKAPAVALMVVSILNIILALWSLIETDFFQPEPATD